MTEHPTQPEPEFVIPITVWKPNATGKHGEFFVRTKAGWQHMRPSGPLYGFPPAGRFYEPVTWRIGVPRSTDNIHVNDQAPDPGPEKPQERAEDPLEQIGAHLTDALASGAAELLHGAEKGLSTARKWLESL